MFVAAAGGLTECDEETGSGAYATSDSEAAERGYGDALEPVEIRAPMEAKEAISQAPQHAEDISGFE